MAVTFQTIQATSAGLYKEKGSKFIGLAYPVSNEDEIKALLDACRKEYFDARHHCFAWVLGPQQAQHRAFDDGEPNHSAGDPILRVIRSHQLTNVLVIVVRYFGGTKLGVSGLIQAYKKAAEDALSHAPVIQVAVKETLHVQLDYAALPEFMQLVKRNKLTVSRQQLDQSCTIDLSIDADQVEMVREKISLLAAIGKNVTLL